MYRNGPFMYPCQKISRFAGRFYVNSFFYRANIVIADNQVADTLWY